MRQVLTLIALTGLEMLQPAVGRNATENDPSQMSRQEWQVRVKASQQRADVMRREHKIVVPQPRCPEDVDDEASRRILEDDSLAPGDIGRHVKVSSNSGAHPTENAKRTILSGFADLRSISTTEVLTCVR